MPLEVWRLYLAALLRGMRAIEAQSRAGYYALGEEKEAREKLPAKALAKAVAEHKERRENNVGIAHVYYPRRNNRGESQDPRNEKVRRTVRTLLRGV